MAEKLKTINVLQVIVIHTNTSVLLLTVSDTSDFKKADDVFNAINIFQLHSALQGMYISAITQQAFRLPSISKASGDLDWFIDPNNFVDSLITLDQV